MNARNAIFLIIILIITGLQCCSPTKRHLLLSTFLDGVPPLDTSSRLVSQNVFNAAMDTSANTTGSANEVVGMNVHPPFRDRQCRKCHQEFSNNLVKPLPSLCFQCHEPFWNTYEKLHGPVISGHCIKCHNPHWTDKKKLLLRAGQDICFECHKQDAILANSKHETIGNRNCTDCHSPHGGKNNFMLKDGSCYNCHDLHMDEPDRFKHGPVLSFNCYECHGTHSTKTEHKLLRSGQDICLKCHQSKDILANKAHETIGETICTECHNPHQSDQKYMLIINKVDEDK